MVDFFFALSGFVIALNYQERLSSFDDVVTFQRRRFFRLYPLHVLMLALFIGIEIAKYAAENIAGLAANNPAFSTNDANAFFSHLFLMQGLFGDGLTWNHPSWSVSTEFFTYIIFAVLTLTLAKRRGAFP